MTTISAEIIEDSVFTGHGIRLTTMRLRYPRFIHSEFMTHRAFSRNASSSRAIPVHRLIDDIERDPAEPIEWGKNQRGMQANKLLTGSQLATAMMLWREHREQSIITARAMADCNAAKQIVNRLQENHGHINVVVTATEWANFLYVRNHPDAAPEIHKLAQVVQDALIGGVPRKITGTDHRVADNWHLPFATEEDRLAHSVESLLALSTARCARVSYLTHDGVVPALEADLKLAYDLIHSDPKHASPAEHQAHPTDHSDFTKNFRGWHMHRAYIPHETIW